MYERLNVSMFPKDSIAFFKNFVERTKENRLNSKQKVNFFMRGPGFDNLLGCEYVNLYLKVDKEDYI